MDELEGKVAELELSSTQALSEVESLRTELQQEKKARDDQLAHLPQQLAEAKAEAVAEFRRPQMFEENLLLLQGPVMQMGQTKAVDVCSEVCHQLNKEDPRIIDLYHPTAAQDFNTQLKQFLDGADLREAED